MKNPDSAVETVLAALRAGGKPSTVAIYRKHGVSGETFGTSYAVMNPLVKKLGTDHALARKLWATGIHDARIVAVGIADAANLEAKEIQAWLRDVNDKATTGALAGLAAKAPAAVEWARTWIDNPAEWISSAGWAVVSGLAIAGRLPVAEARSLLARIERELQRSKNRVRHSMNNALIAIGGSIPALTASALASARKIGKVVVDHGDTACETPDAVGYIEKMVGRGAPAKGPRMAKAKPTPRRGARA